MKLQIKLTLSQVSSQKMNKLDLFGLDFSTPLIFLVLLKPFIFYKTLSSWLANCCFMWHCHRIRLKGNRSSWKCYLGHQMWSESFRYNSSELKHHIVSPCLLHFKVWGFVVCLCFGGFFWVKPVNMFFTFTFSTLQLPYGHDQKKQLQS